MEGAEEGGPKLAKERRRFSSCEVFVYIRVMASHLDIVLDVYIPKKFPGEGGGLWRNERREGGLSSEEGSAPDDSLFPSQPSLLTI